MKVVLTAWIPGMHHQTVGFVMVMREMMQWHTEMMSSTKHPSLATVTLQF